MCGDARMLGLVHHGLLPPRTDALKWILSGNERFPAPPDGYVVSLVHFHERGLVAPTHRFLLRLLD
jgi:hypothetical protein